MRRGEIARVHSDDLGQDLLGWSLTVHGKGGKDRVVPLADDVAPQLLALPHGWAFPGRDDDHLSPGYVGKLVAAALPGGCRPETTRDYIELPRESLREAVRKAA